MSTFDEASLVFIPSGYKTSKAYSVKPTDGSGDLVVSRSNDTATRVGPDGLIEKVRTNLLLQSQDFTTSWATNASPTITANTTVAPDGTTTADTIASSGASSGAYQIPTVANGVEYSFSVYVKNITSATNIQIGCDLNPSNGTIFFNAVTGAITFVSAGITGSSVTSVGNGWYRVSGTYISSGTTNTLIIFGQTGMSFAVWGAQLEAGVTTDYIATTSAAVSVGPVANVPRLDYLNSSCPRLLLEPQRTNYAIYSENISQSSTTLSGGTVATNVVASPDGMQDADSFTVNTANSAHSGYYEAYNATNGQPFTVSVFAKAGTGRYFLFRSMTNTYATRFGATIDLQTGTILSTNNAGVPAPTGTASKIESYGNGWYRISLTMNAIGSQMSYIWETSNSATPTLDAFLDYTYTGNGTDSYYVWGLQMENGAYATSYIPTLGAAVTRGADAASKTGISSLIGQTEGTLFVDMNYTNTNNSVDATPFRVLGSGSAQMYVEINTNETFEAVVVNSAGTLVFNSTSAAQVAGRKKMAIAYKGSDFAYYINGTQISVQTSGAFASASLDSLNLGMYSSGVQVLADTINQALIFPTRLTNAQLAELTTI
jgi:hypothetical protein